MANKGPVEAVGCYVLQEKLVETEPSKEGHCHDGEISSYLFIAWDVVARLLHRTFQNFDILLVFVCCSSNGICLIC